MERGILQFPAYSEPGGEGTNLDFFNYSFLKQLPRLESKINRRHNSFALVLCYSDSGFGILFVFTNTN